MGEASHGWLKGRQVRGTRRQALPEATQPKSEGISGTRALGAKPGVTQGSVRQTAKTRETLVQAAVGLPGSALGP